MFSRRDFGKMAMAGVPLALGAAKLNSTVKNVLIGCQSYSFRDRPLDDAIKAIAEVGLSEVELWQGHVEPKVERGDDGRKKLREWRLSAPASEFQAIKQKFDAAGITLYAYNYSFRDDMSDEELDRGFVMAKALGVKAITASSTLSTARRLAPFADKHKLLVAMHGHSNLKDENEFATPESFDKAMAVSKYFRVNLDVGHFFAAGFDPVRYIMDNHDKIVTLHLKDRKANQGDNMPFGEGQTPLKQVLLLLSDRKWKIPANIEYEYKGADAVAEVRKCVEYCKKALA
jgi:sugar phosphate isomerase/epimerase